MQVYVGQYLGRQYLGLQTLAPSTCDSTELALTLIVHIAAWSASQVRDVYQDVR
jgi:hypothetical protein